MAVNTIESVMDHCAYRANLVGIEHVIFGLDTAFGDHVAHADAREYPADSVLPR